METLKGLVYLETRDGIEKWCLAVEDPKNKNHTRVIKCRGQAAHNRTKFSRKRAGFWKFKAFRFQGKIEDCEILKKSISCIIPIPNVPYNQIPVNELKKLKEWID